MVCGLPGPCDPRVFTLWTLKQGMNIDGSDVVVDGGLEETVLRGSEGSEGVPDGAWLRPGAGSGVRRRQSRKKEGFLGGSSCLSEIGG